MAAFLFLTLVLLPLLGLSSIALPLDKQHDLTSHHKTPAWANEVTPPSINHNIHPDEALPARVAADADQTIHRLSAPPKFVAVTTT